MPFPTFAALGENDSDASDVEGGVEETDGVVSAPRPNPRAAPSSSQLLASSGTQLNAVARSDVPLGNVLGAAPVPSLKTIAKNPIALTGLPLAPAPTPGPVATGSSDMIAKNPINTFSGVTIGMPMQSHTPRPTDVVGSIPQIAKNPISPATCGATGLPQAPVHTSGPALTGSVPMVAKNPTNPITSVPTVPLPSQTEEEVRGLMAKPSRRTKRVARGRVVAKNPTNPITRAAMVPLPMQTEEEVQDLTPRISRGCKRGARVPASPRPTVVDPPSGALEGPAKAPVQTAGTTAVAGSIPQIAENRISLATGGVAGLSQDPALTSCPAVAGSSGLIAKNPINASSGAPEGGPMAHGPGVAIVGGQAATFPISAQASSSMPIGGKLSTSAAIVGTGPSGVPSSSRYPDANATPDGNWPAAPANQNHGLGGMGSWHAAIQAPAQSGFAPQFGAANVLSVAASGGVALPVTLSYDLESMECEYTGYSPAIEWPAQCGFVPPVPNVTAITTSDGVTSGWGADVPPHGRDAVSQLACAQRLLLTPADWPTAPPPDMVANDTLFPPGHKVTVEIPRTSLLPFALPAVVWPPLPQLLPVEMDWEPTHAIVLTGPGASRSTGPAQVASGQATQTAVAAVVDVPSPGGSGEVTGRDVQPLQRAPLRHANWNRGTGVHCDSLSISDAHNRGQDSMRMRACQQPARRGVQARRWENFADVRIVRGPSQSRPEERSPGRQPTLVSDQPPAAPSPPARTRPALAPSEPIWGPNQIRMLKVGAVCYGLLLGASYFGLI